MTYFKDLGLAEPILRAVDATGYTTPTPIQRDIIPLIIDRKDVIGIAQTGTGKTAAFVLPSLNRIAAQNYPAKPRTCGTLILTPTRELANQINDSIKTYSKFMQMTSAVIVGGVKSGPQVKACARGLDILVATPGRLLDLMGSGAIRLDATQQVIADEADQMMDMGFLPSIRKIMQALPKKRQTMLLSATMPTQIRSLAKDFMNNPVEISVTPVSKPIERINQIVKPVAKSEKRQALVEILGDTDMTRVVVFARTKHGANKLALYLEKSGQKALAIHGNKSQSQREKALASFKAGRTRILVATDIAARGIDIDDVSHVVNFELPNVPETYVHRIGRTARAGRSGVAITLCDHEEIKLLRDIEKLTKQDLMPDAYLVDTGRDNKSHTPGRRNSKFGPKSGPKADGRNGRKAAPKGGRKQNRFKSDEEQGDKPARHPKKYNKPRKTSTGKDGRPSLGQRHSSRARAA